MTFQQHTFEHKDCQDELEVLSAALQLIGEKRYVEAVNVLVRRHDKLTEKPKLILYDPRAGA